MLELNVDDMTCGHCVASITKAVKAVAPAATVQADLNSHRVSIDGASDHAAVIAAIAEAGFTASSVQS